MSIVETEEPPRPMRGFLLALGIVGLLVGGLVAAELAPLVGGRPLQPPLGGGNTPVLRGMVVMPQGVGSNTLLNFEPAIITVFIGFNNTVKFENPDTSAPKHTVSASDKSFDSGDILPGKSWTYTFSTPGNFSYYCLYHATWMKGKVIVKGAGQGISLVRIPSGTGLNASLNYSPSSITLVVGVNNTVVFSNEDSDKHTISALDGSFDSGDMLASQSWSHTFAVGTYSFHCIYHAYMTGTIEVKSA